jgi:hypothetical protein
VALRVKHGHTVDTILSTLDPPPYPTRATSDGASLRGRLGITRQQVGKTTDLWLFEGEALSAADASLRSENSFYDGQILSALRKDDGDAYDAFITDTPLPVSNTLRGLWMIVTHGNGFRRGYQIDRVEAQDGKTAVVLSDDHGLKTDGTITQQVYFPQRKIEGVNRFVIPLAATLSKTHER